MHTALFMDEPALLEELKNILEKMGVKVCEQKLEADAEKAKSGMVRVKQQKKFFLEKNLKPRDQIGLLLQAVKKLDLSGIYVSPYLRSIIEEGNEKKA